PLPLVSLIRMMALESVNDPTHKLNTMKKILVATDFSACASNAMDYAMELAKVIEAEVCAIHAIGSFEGVFNNTYNALYIEDYHNSKRQALQNWVNLFSSRATYSGIPVTTA